MAYRVSEQMIEAYGDIIHSLSLNRQRRLGDPVRLLDYDAIERQRADMGLSDRDIAARIGLAPEQITLIRNIGERRRFRANQYRKLFALGGGRRFRESRYRDPATAMEVSGDARLLREALAFSGADVEKFIGTGLWTGETLGDWLERAAGDAPAIIANQTICYSELGDRARGFAAGLADMGIRLGDVVALRLANCPEFVIAYLGAALLGAVAQLIPANSSLKETFAFVRHSRARMLVCAGPMARFAVEQGGAVIAVGEKIDGARAFDDMPRSLSETTPLAGPVAADPALLLHTAGVTGAPKSVPHTYQTIIANARLSAARLEVESSDVIGSALPFSNHCGLFALHLALCAGASVTLSGAPHGAPSLLFKHPGHDASAMWDMADTPPRLVMTSGAPRSDDGYENLWGMAELPAGCFTTPGEPRQEGSESSGRPAPGIEMRIAAETGDEGELEVRGCALFPGYYGDPVATARAFTDDGWFKTGDRAILDHQGYVRVLGRLEG